MWELRNSLNLIILLTNYENHENHKMSCDNHKRYRIPSENHETNENLRILREYWKSWNSTKTKSDNQKKKWQSQNPMREQTKNIKII